MSEPAAPPRARTLLVLMVAVTAAAAGDLLLAHGMKGAAAAAGEIAAFDVAHLGAFARVSLGAPAVIAGVACMAVFFALYLAALSWADLSFVLPITALSFVIVTLFAQLVLHEHVSAARWAGVLCIVFGVFRISRS